MSSPIAVVTGASRGIGRAITQTFAQKGYEVWALARSLEALHALSRQSSPGKIRPLALDAENPGSVEQAARTILDTHTPSVWVNNAGIAFSASLEETDDALWQRTLAVNVTAPFAFCRAVMPRMAQQGFGRVINIASTAAVRGFKYTSAYCASKHALLGLTRSLAHEYADKKITVNAVCPGWTDTDMASQAVANISKATGRDEAAARARLVQASPLKRMVTPEEVASLVEYLASEAASAITGAAYLLDGGETA